MKLRDKYGWPVERIKGRPFVNFIRLLLHTNIKQTWKKRNIKYDGPRKTMMTITMEVTEAQGLTLQAMFEYWNQLSGMGGSRMVSFYADGDGNFHPRCKIKFDKKLPELTGELKEAAIAHDDYGDRQYDFDGLAWVLHDDQETT